MVFLTLCLTTLFSWVDCREWIERMSMIFLDITSCSLSIWYRRFRRTCCLYLQVLCQRRLQVFPKRWCVKMHSVTPHYAVIQTHCRENLVYYEQRGICGWWAWKAVDWAVVQSEGLSGATEGKAVKNLRQTTTLEWWENSRNLDFESTEQECQPVSLSFWYDVLDHPVVIWKFLEMRKPVTDCRRRRELAYTVTLLCH